MNKIDIEKVKKYILNTYTPENYYKLWLYMYSMVGEGFVAAEELLYQIQPNDELFDFDIDKLADDLVKELQGDK